MSSNSISVKILNRFKENQKTLLFSFYVFLFFIILWGLISITRIGFSTTEDYWYEAGVPILLQQVIMSLVIGIGFGIIEKKFTWEHSRRINQIVFFSIWIVTAVLWAIQPVNESYVNPAPRLPNLEMYPYSDGMKYDIASQFVIIGQKLNNQKAVDTPLYSLFLVFVHAISGQNYQDNMAVQAAILAILPAIIYLIGNILHGRIAGVILSSLIALRGINSIEAVSIISTASPKQMLTDFPAAIGIALILMCFLFSFYEKKKSLLILAGACFSFAFLIRANTLALIGLIPLIVFFPKLIQIKQWHIILFVFLGLILVLTPWGVRNIIYSDQGLTAYLSKFNLVVEERYPETKDERIESPSSSDNETEESSESSNEKKNIKETTSEDIFSVVQIVSNHFVHNLVTSVLILPTLPSFDSLNEILKSEYMYWKPFWNGTLSIRSFLFLIISLGILAIGIGTSIKRNGLVGLIPLFGFLLYQLANAVGRTSGGRYIVPVDWILILYYAIGLVELFFILTNTRFFSEAKVNSVSSYFDFTENVSHTMIFVFVIALVLPISEIIFPLRYEHPKEERKQIPENPFFLTALASTGYTEEQVITFLKEERKSVLMLGRVLYPRYFFFREAIQFPEDAIYNLTYPRLEFILIGPNNKQTVILANQTPTKLQNISDVFVLGCDQEDGYVEFIDAIFIIPYHPEQEFLIRQPLLPLQCPLPKMVCDNNGKCQ